MLPIKLIEDEIKTCIVVRNLSKKWAIQNVKTIKTNSESKYVLFSFMKYEY